MKITKIRMNGQKLTAEQMAKLKQKLSFNLSKAGFVTDVSIVNSTCIHLGCNRKSFIINTALLGYNTRYNPHSGPKRSSTPTWNQRVTYNNIINDLLNHHKITANIVSGPFIIRKGDQCYTETNWFQQIPEWMLHNENKGHYISKGFDFVAQKERQKSRRRQLREEKKRKEFVAKPISIVSDGCIYEF